MKFTSKLSFLLLFTICLLIFPSHCYVPSQDQQGKSPEGSLTQCMATCDREQDRASECFRTCVEKIDRLRGEYEKQKSEHGGKHNADQGREPQQQGESENPYYFESRRFESKFSSGEGTVKILERFSQGSEILHYLKPYRVKTIEARPKTIVLPHHIDAAALFVVIRGKGTLSYIYQNERQSFSVQSGDVIRIPVGSISYLTNDINQLNFYGVELVLPLNSPGSYQEFYGVGGQNPESFLKLFSDNILQNAFKTPRRDLDMLFGQNGGAILRVSDEQLRALSEEPGSYRGTGKEDWEGPVNLFNNNQPLFLNLYGRHYELAPENHAQLRDTGVSVGYMRLYSGAMTPPYFNSRATKLVIVTSGEGFFEMVCPHWSSQSGSGKGFSGLYRKVTAKLSEGDFFIIPAGHPIVIVSTRRLTLFSFGINGAFSEKYFLAGQGNVWEKMHAEVKELGFKAPAAKLEELLRRQQESQFLPYREGRGRLVGSILDVAGF